MGKIILPLKRFESERKQRVMKKEEKFDYALLFLISLSSFLWAYFLKVTSISFLDLLIPYRAQEIIGKVMTLDFLLFSLFYSFSLALAFYMAKNRRKVLLIPIFQAVPLLPLTFLVGPIFLFFYFTYLVGTFFGILSIEERGLKAPMSACQKAFMMVSLLTLIFTYSFIETNKAWVMATLESEMIKSLPKEAVSIPTTISDETARKVLSKDPNFEKLSEEEKRMLIERFKRLYSHVATAINTELERMKKEELFERMREKVPVLRVIEQYLPLIFALGIAGLASLFGSFLVTPLVLLFSILLFSSGIYKKESLREMLLGT